jgi:pimeloyl-ACP methyl ester carboxylesterase
VVLEACGHSPHRDQPAATREAIMRFVHGLADGLMLPRDEAELT